MAYRDRNGKITIDEYAANQDIKRLSEAVQVLKESRNAVRNLQQKAEDLRGETSVAIQNKGQEMYQKLTRMIDKLEETIAFIRKTVRYYEELDAEIKRSIQAAADAAAAVTAVASAKVSGGGGTSSGGGSSRDFGTSSSSGSSWSDSVKTAPPVAGGLLDDIF